MRRARAAKPFPAAQKTQAARLGKGVKMRKLRKQ